MEDAYGRRPRTSKLCLSYLAALRYTRYSGDGGLKLKFLPMPLPPGAPPRTQPPREVPIFYTFVEAGAAPQVRPARPAPCALRAALPLACNASG